MTSVLTPEEVLDDIKAGVDVIMLGLATLGRSPSWLSAMNGEGEGEGPHASPDEVLDEMKAGAKTIDRGVGALRALSIEVSMLRRRQAAEEERKKDRR